MIDLSKCKKGDVLICKHGVIKEYVRPITEEDNSFMRYYDHIVKCLYIPYDEKFNKYDRFYPVKGTICNDGFVYRKNRSKADFDVIKVVDRQVFKRYLRMLSHKL